MQDQNSLYNFFNNCWPARSQEDTSWLLPDVPQTDTVYGNQPEDINATYSFSTSIEHFHLHLSALFGLGQKIEELKEAMIAVKKNPTILTHQIYGLSLPSYRLKHPLNIILEIYADEVIATLPDLKLYGEGGNQFEAIKDLKDELIDLFNDLSEIPDESLDDEPLSWKQIVNDLMEKV